MNQVHQLPITDLAIVSRSMFLSALPSLRSYVLDQLGELPNASKRRTRMSLSKELPLIQINGAKKGCIDEQIQVVGYIDTDSPPYRRFARELNEVYAAYSELQNLKRAGEAQQPIHVTMKIVDAAALSAKAYITGYRVYMAARSAHERSIGRYDLAAYWQRIEI